uniref:Uncharacterized protein n=1 Tax=Physcomitrium patens TaxID=3218 RepID=A0A7I4EX61_PHYPA
MLAEFRITVCLQRRILRLTWSAFFCAKRATTGRKISCCWMQMPARVGHQPRRSSDINFSRIEIAITNLVVFAGTPFFAQDLKARLPLGIRRLAHIRCWML